MKAAQRHVAPGEDDLPCGMEGGQRHVAADEDLAPAQWADVLHEHMELRDVRWDDYVFHGQSVPRGRQ